jgi:hypothetical protein
VTEPGRVKAKAVGTGFLLGVVSTVVTLLVFGDVRYVTRPEFNSHAALDVHDQRNTQRLGDVEDAVAELARHADWQSGVLYKLAQRNGLVPDPPPGPNVNHAPRR